MRARFFIVTSALALVATAFVVQACGETEPTSTTTGTDSGADVVDSGQKETAPPEQDSATCDLGADFSAKIPDASIADGATTSGICLGCAKSKCTDEVKACNTDCTCQELATDAVTCYLANTTNPVVCAGNFVGVDTNTQQLAFGMLNCLNESCKEECATESFQSQDAGNDADAN